MMFNPVALPPMLVSNGGGLSGLASPGAQLQVGPRPMMNINQGMTPSGIPTPGAFGGLGAGRLSRTTQ